MQPVETESPTINNIISDIQCLAILYSNECAEIERVFFSFINSPEEAVFISSNFSKYLVTLTYIPPPVAFDVYETLLAGEC